MQGSQTSVQSSPYTSSSYHLNLVNNQMAQLHQLQLDLQREKEQKEELQRRLEQQEAIHGNRQESDESGGNGEDSGEQGGSNCFGEEEMMSQSTPV